MSVVQIYRLLNDDKLPEGLEMGCMKNQMDYISGLALFNPDTMLGNTCDLPSPAK
jgi:hypothetical protein